MTWKALGLLEVLAGSRVPRSAACLRRYPKADNVIVDGAVGPETTRTA